MINHSIREWTLLIYQNWCHIPEFINLQIINYHQSTNRIFLHILIHSHRYYIWYPLISSWSSPKSLGLPWKIASFLVDTICRLWQIAWQRPSPSWSTWRSVAGRQVMTCRGMSWPRPWPKRYPLVMTSGFRNSGFTILIVPYFNSTI